MRFAYLAVFAAACGTKDPPPTSERPAATAVAPVAIDAATVADASVAKARDVELVRGGAVAVRVSSKVANRKILPEHLVDGDLATAWNSLTGELAGAWIELLPIDGAEIHELRMTSGFTARGPKNENWFTMNPRITKLHVTVDGVAAPDLVLDPAKETLQAFRVEAKKSVRLDVAGVVMGSKKQWREISMSELEAWGSAPAGWAPPVPLRPIPVEVGTPTVGADFDPCAEAGEEKNGGEEDCGPMDIVTVGEALEGPWSSTMAWCYVHDHVHGPKTCYVQVGSGASAATVELEHAMAHADITASLEMSEVFGNSDGRELVIHWKRDDEELTSVCRTTPTLRCSEPLAVPTGANLAAQPWVFK